MLMILMGPVRSVSACSPGLPPTQSGLGLLDTLAYPAQAVHYWSAGHGHTGSTRALVSSHLAHYQILWV